MDASSAKALLTLAAADVMLFIIEPIPQPDALPEVGAAALPSSSPFLAPSSPFLASAVSEEVEMEMTDFSPSFPRTGSEVPVT